MDVYIPWAKNVICLDVNSLYPYIMKVLYLPVGIPKYIIGENIKLKDIFGFCQVRVTTPIDLKCPTLPSN